MRKQVFSNRKISIPGIAWGIIFLIVFFSILRPAKFPTLYNMHLILRHSSVLIVASIGMTMIILLGQIDMSVGAVMSLSGAVMAVCAGNGIPLPLTLLLSVLSGVAVGAANGFMVAILRFDFWVSTFATMSVAAGLALVVTGGQTLAINSDLFKWFGNGRILGVEFLVSVMLILTALSIFILGRTRFGYNIYSIGGSEETSHLSGINVSRNRMTAYILSGFFASVAGLMLASMGSSASPIAGADYSFDAIAAVIIGGASFDGGKGGIAGTVLGAVMLRILTLGFNLMGISPIWQRAIIGIVIVGTIIGDVLSEKWRTRKESRRVYRNV